jgi:hypothetical protein
MQRSAEGRASPARSTLALYFPMNISSWNFKNTIRRLFVFVIEMKGYTMKSNQLVTEKLTINLKKNGHTKGRMPLIDINQEGRYRVSNLIAILGVSHSTLYAGIKNGRYPEPDGWDGVMPYWKTQTVKKFLEN